MSEKSYLWQNHLSIAYFKTHIFSLGIAFIPFLCYNIEYDYTEWRELHWKNSA